MSLIKCPECGHQVSSKAETCPECGVRIAGNVKRCPICQRTVLMYVAQCPHCHTRFETQPEIMLEPGGEGEGEVAPHSAPEGATDASSSVNTSTDAPSGAVGEGNGSVAPKKGMPWYLLLFIIVVIGVGGYLYWDNYQQRRYSEEKAFNLLRDCNDPLNFEDFIARYPNSEHLEEVRAQLRELQKEDAVWEVVAGSSNTEDYRNFIQTHPRSPFVKVAQHKIDSLDWREADSKGTSEAYDRYIAAHAAGEYVTEAYSARDAARAREERALRDSLAAEQARADSLASAEAAMGIDELVQ